MRDFFDAILEPMSMDMEPAPDSIRAEPSLTLKAAEDQCCSSHPPEKPALRRPDTTRGQRRMMFQIKPVR
ncbi:hypothetical protein ILFOPFJJ_05685 [Ensifer psoraleae]|nr:hypothetical protein [Sinorhizobium psoraleae]